MKRRGLECLLFVASLLVSACGDDLCEDADAVCRAAEPASDLRFDPDCPNEETECRASCIVDAGDCSSETLVRCDDICRPFVGS